MYFDSKYHKLYLEFVGFFIACKGKIILEQSCLFQYAVVKEMCGILVFQRVKEATKAEWSQTLNIPPLLHNSPALHYLRSDYFHDEVGMSPTNADFRGKIPSTYLLK